MTTAWAGTVAVIAATVFVTVPVQRLRRVYAAAGGMPSETVVVEMIDRVLV